MVDVEQPMGLAPGMHHTGTVQGNSSVFHMLPRLAVGRRTRLRAVPAAALLVWVGCAESREPTRSAPTHSAPVATSSVVDDSPDVGTDAGAELADAYTPPDAWRRARPRAAEGALFDPSEDEEITERLRTEEIVAVERGRGGRSVAFRLTLASGARAYFKPEQTFSGTHWYAEIAAFHLDRLLRVNRTAPSTSRVVPYALLEPALAGEARARELILREDGTVRGAIIAWVEERLVPIDPPDGWESALRLSEPAPVFPFVAPIELRRAQAAREASSDGGVPSDAGERSSDAALGLSDAGPEDGRGWDREARARELSIVVAFDFLTQNGDRWGGNFTNVRMRGEGGPIILLDNAAGFWRRRARSSRRARPIVVDPRLAFVERFDAAFVRRVRRLDVGALRARLAGEDLPILDDAQLEYLEERRQALIRHVDAVVEREGEDRALAW